MAFVPAVKPPVERSARSHWFVVRDGACLVRASFESRLSLPSAVDLEAIGVSVAGADYLGRCNDEDCFVIEADRVALTEPWSWCGLRQLYGQLDEELFAVAGRAVQIAAFALNHRHCGRCGLPTSRDVDERCIRCTRCELVVYPRIAPAIIVLVRRGEQALLARSARFTSAFYSTLAGFVEPGESLEQTLEREVFEEVGILVHNVRYFGSQPWPFPHSLMVGFIADYAGGELTVDGTEIVDAGWFDPDALPQIPPKPSIARRMIDAWLREVHRQPP